MLFAITFLSNDKTSNPPLYYTVAMARARKSHFGNNIIIIKFARNLICMVRFLEVQLGVRVISP